MVDKDSDVKYNAGGQKAQPSKLFFMKKSANNGSASSDKDSQNESSMEMPDFRLAALGIQKENLTPEVSEAVALLLGRIDELTGELSRTRENLSELEQLVDVDCLAPIPNRRAFMRKLEWAISMHERYNFPVSILYFDLNNLKQINDTLGHSAGDAAIRHVSAVLASGTRESDFIARIGGDEFAIILFHSDYSNAARRADALSGKLKHSPLSWNGQEIPLSAACGSYSIQQGDTAETAMIAADSAMYENKKALKASKHLETFSA